MKVCSMCKLLKEDNAFGISKTTKSGLTSRCKSCNNEVFKLKYRDLEKYRNHRKKVAESPEGKKYHLEYMRQYRSTNKDKAYHFEYNRSSKGVLADLKKRLLKTKKESTKQKLNERIKELENEITRNNIK
jgi:hypothetical protein